MDNTTKQIIGIISFLGAVLLIYEVGGGKPAIYFLVLVLLGVLMKNADKLKTIQ
jgi:hypothetical protein